MLIIYDLIITLIILFKHQIQFIKNRMVKGIISKTATLLLLNEKKET
jgi:hypothetical protein